MDNMALKASNDIKISDTSPSINHTDIATIISSQPEHKPRRIVWRCSQKGRPTLAHFISILQLKRLHQNYKFSCSILVSDLGAFLDREKCPWAEMKVVLFL